MLRTPTALLASLALLGAAALSTHALADDYTSDSNPVGYYIGAGVGASNVHQGFFDSGVDDFRTFDDSRLGWKVLVGLRPLEWLGAEAEYIDFGSSHLGASPIAAGGPSSGAEFYGAHASAAAGAGFAVAYLPLPPWVDLFGKLGFADVQTRYSYAGNYPLTPYAGCGASCPTLRLSTGAQDRSDTGVAYGAGAQIHFGAFAARLEYERVSGAWQPSLLSLDLTWAP